ncbi:MAG: molybdopterin-dependent oxidoreductase, partial [Acidimicrobiales bacterium]|nr:molybdopterin-dependent oxidoreductase [Acidimicrobiales bacterium]
MTTTTDDQPDATVDLEPSVPDDGAHGASNRVRGALSGLLAAGAALGTAELFSGFSKRIPSLVVAVGDVFVDNTPGGIVRWSIERFGSNQKTVLVWGISITALVLGAVLGAASRRRFAIGAAGFAAFGLLGALAASRYPGSSTPLSWLTAIVAAAIGVLVLRALHTATAPTDRDTATGLLGLPAGEDRRRFLVFAGAAAFLGIFGAGLGRRLRDRFGVEQAREEVALRLGSSASPADGEALRPTEIATLADVDGISPIITPNDDFYRIDTALSVPQVDPATWKLRITGLVDRELEFSFDDLLEMDMVERNITLSCVSNDVGGHLVGNARWRGVPLATLLEQAGVSPDCTQIVGRSVDGWTAGFPTEIVFDGRPAMVAVTMNDEPLPIKHGFPARLVVAGLYGYVSATKWVTEIECTTWEAFDAYWIPRGWAKDGPMKTQSRIDTPRRNADLTAGTTAIA